MIPLVNIRLDIILFLHLDNSPFWERYFIACHVARPIAPPITRILNNYFIIVSGCFWWITKLICVRGWKGVWKFREIRLAVRFVYCSWFCLGYNAGQWPLTRELCSNGKIKSGHQKWINDCRWKNQCGESDELFEFFHDAFLHRLITDMLRFDKKPLNRFEPTTNACMLQI